MFNKVLAATARPLECDESVLSAGRIAAHNNGKLLILHVLESESSIYRNYVKHYRSGEEILGDEADIRRIRQRLEEEFLNDIPDTVEAEIDTWGGVYPDIEIEKHARRKDVDLIVMGSHTKMNGKAAGSRWYVGSAVERVSARSVCPVAVITDPKVLEKY